MFFRSNQVISNSNSLSITQLPKNNDILKLTFDECDIIKK